MLKKTSVMVMLGKRNNVDVCRLETDKSTQQAICKSFSNAYENFLKEKNKIKFDGSYKPDEDELLYIDSYDLNKQIIEAVKEPSGMEPFIPNLEQPEDILAVFVGEISGEDSRIVFQRFRKEQYISTRGFNIFFDRNTFIREKRYGITIADSVDCVWENGKLQFNSYFMARQIFDLQDYYRIATEKEVDDFTRQTVIDFEEPQVFQKYAGNSRVRKMIAEIMDSEVLKNYTPDQIRQMAKKQTGVELNIRHKKIVIPQEKEKMKVVLGVLAEGVYKGIFSKETYIANSKRTVKS